MIYLNTIAYFIFILMIGYYFITNMQWYSYRLKRVIFHHTKVWWHFIYFLIPFISYELTSALTDKKYGFTIVLIYTIFFIFWIKNLDKKLIFTGRVKRFFIALLGFAIFITFISKSFTIFIPLMLAWGVSSFIEKMLFNGFVKMAKKKIDNMDSLIIIGVTASYGKTSIKNYLQETLKTKYKTYATPRSVNTFGGIVADINQKLPDDTEVYIVEMGAREKGDIAEISTFINPHYAVVGKIGSAHIEYFKSLENIRDTKMEIIQSSRLKEAWIHHSANINPSDKIHQFGEDISNIKASLDETSFEVDNIRYSTNLLGSFNAINLTAVIKVAKALDISDSSIIKSFKNLKQVPHRLQRIDAGGKIILDDSFNGNIDGMMASFELVKTYQGRKVIITPGLVEANNELNIQVAKKVNEIFDIIIVSGDLNCPIFQKEVDKDKFVRLKNKSDMEETLVTQTQIGDLILFSNDAPSFI
ncbi:UDP-N-acetylmuramoylalanyl-D-glutamyl-2,6-diaminopimelate--D-alanyl-D-alanine ligase [hydrothermal vent metagenome]|uniref:UDP-N-acetylmuramoylalanyl-D-glutamyl-2,6-diaminopimelate--D-alanyl-D-alanine ligase n=1 Tax=hydrothermal vent metagenome TaxID=652676 RepID=A0A1W1BF61_9ZZZZ